MFANDPNSGPVFLLGTGRCGSTFFQKNICKLPDLWIWGEHDGVVGRLLDWVQQTKESESLNRFSYSRRDCNPKNLLNADLSLDATKFAWINGFRTGDLDEIVKNTINQLMTIGLPEGKSRWGFKEIRYGMSDNTPERLLQIFPNSKIIHTLRNPYDTIESSLFSWNGKEIMDALSIGDQKKVLFEYNNFLSRWCDITNYYLNLATSYPNRVKRARLEFAGEDLGAVVGFLGYKNDIGVFDFERVNALAPLAKNISKEGRSIIIECRKFGYNRIISICEKIGYNDIVIDDF